MVRPIPPFARFSLVLAVILAADVRVATSQLIERAQVYQSQGNLDAAIGDLRSVLRDEPGNDGARAMLVGAYIDKAAVLRQAKRLDQAVSELENALHFDRENATARALLVEHYSDLAAAAKSGRDRIALLKRAVQTVPAHAGARLRLGEAFIGVELALAEALEIDPGNVRAEVGLGHAALRRGDTAAATAALQRATAIAPVDANVPRLRGDLSYRRGDYAAAVDAYGEVLEAKFDPLVRMNQVLSQIATGGSVAIVAEVERVLAEAPRHTGANYLRALAAFDQSDYEAARRHIAAVQAVKPDHAPSRLIHGAAAFALGDYTLAETHLNAVLDFKPEHIEARRLAGLAMLRLDRPDEAVAALDALTLGPTADPDTVALVGSAAVQAGSLAAGHDYFTALAALAPLRADAQARLGAVKAALGDFAGGKRALQSALQRDPTLGHAQLALALALLRTGAHDLALAAAHRVIELAPQDPTGHVLTGLVHFIRGEAGPARLRLTRALEIRDDDHDALVVLAEVLVSEGDLAAARMQLTAVVAQHSADLRSWLRLAELDFRAGDASAAEARLLAAAGEHPAALAPLVMLGRLYLSAGRPDRALDVTEGRPRDDVDNLALRHVIGRALVALDRPAEAIVVLGPLAAALPDVAPVHYTTATAHARAGDMAGRQASLQRVLELDPGHIAATVDLARLALQRADFEAADSLVAALRGMAPAAVLEFDGRAALRAGRYEDAVTVLTEASRSVASTSVTVALAEAHGGMGRSDTAVSLLEGWLARMPADRAARFAVATHYIDQGRLDDALVNLLLLEDDGRQELGVSNNIAWVYLGLGNAAGALPYAERALRLAAGDAAVTDTAVQVFRAAGDPDRARELLARAEAPPQ